ncbi:MAG: hypothetical protein ACW99U_03965 [Candidatus Thorarchaeota archaeon]|jgi:hypothetical protein
MRSKAKAFFLLSLTFLMTLPGFTVMTTADPANPDVILVDCDNPTAQFILEQAHLSERLGKPIIVYSHKPASTVSIETTTTNCSLDTRDGTFIESVVSTEVEDHFAFEYTVITPEIPSARIRTESFITKDTEDEHFAKMLEEEIVNLSAIQFRPVSSFVLSGYSGDTRAIGSSYTPYEKTYTLKISAIDNGNGWTWKTSLNHQVWKSVYDYETGYRWWLGEWNYYSYVDPYDFKRSFFEWVGPWVYERWSTIDPRSWQENPWEQLYAWDPTTSVGTSSSGVSVGVKISPTGPTVSFAASASWSGSEVGFQSLTDTDTDVYKLKEYFTGPSYIYPFWIGGPCDASHYEYHSYREAVYHSSQSDVFDFSQKLDTRLARDYGFYLLFWTLRWTRATTSLVATTGHSYA